MKNIKKIKIVYLVFIILLLNITFISAQQTINENHRDKNFLFTKERHMNYAVVIKQSTYDKPNWQAVANTLQSKYQGEIFIWNNSLDEVKDEVSSFKPTYIGFICETTTANPNFIQTSVWPFTRALDDDVYCDAIWGIITGYDAEDALNLVTAYDGFEIKTVLGGTSCCDLSYYTQGIGTSETTYGTYYVKYPDSTEITTYTDGPTDRTEWLVNMINTGIDIFNFAPVDIFYTSGHGNYNVWQLHYPVPGEEGYFRSNNGQVYGDPHTGADININSNNPKVYFGLGNCNIGQIYNGSCMAPSWIHSGGVYQYTGYIIGEGSDSQQHGGTKAYFYKVSRNNTWAEAYFLSNQSIKFDIINNTPGVNPGDLNGSALYGDPGMQVKMSNEGVFEQALFTSNLIVNEGIERDTITYKITMNREGCPGNNGKWGNRHPAVIFPFRAENIEIIYTDAITSVVKDNFALMYIWYQGQPPLSEGETREVIFTCNHISTRLPEPLISNKKVNATVLYQNSPNPFKNITKIIFFIPKDNQVQLLVYNISGKKIKTLIQNKKLIKGSHSIIWNAKDDNNERVSCGMYYYTLKVDKFIYTKKMILLK